MTPTTLTARTPEDLVAAVPCILGFYPEDSLVMLTFAPSGRSFHARVDLPADEGELDDVVDMLLDAALRNEVDRVAFIAYADGAGTAYAVRDALLLRFGVEGIEVIEMLRVADGRWFPMRGGLPQALYDGVPYDVTAHPFAAQAVLDGRVTLASREELAATLTEASPDQVAAVHEQARHWLVRTAEMQRPAEARWVLETVDRHATAGTVLAPEALARLLVDCIDTELRDVAWSLMARDNAHQHVELWRDAVRRSPMWLLPAPAALLGFAAWLSGQGALAWCAVDRCREADPGYSMADRVADVLIGAMPPHLWEGIRAEDLPLLGPSGAGA